jgi:FMN reductase
MQRRADERAPVERLALAIAGSPSPTSTSRRLAERLLGLLGAAGWSTELVNLAALPAEPLLARGEDRRVQEALHAVERANVLVLATPVYRATYTGLLKSFFDLMPEGLLAGKACVLIATGAAPGHLLAIDHGLRPLVASLGGLGAAASVYATPADFVDETPGPELTARLASAAEEAARIAAPAPAEAP